MSSPKGDLFSYVGHFWTNHLTSATRGSPNCRTTEIITVSVSCFTCAEVKIDLDDINAV
jgi:hypothetical protein